MGGQVAAPFYATCSSARVLDEFSKSIPPITKPSTKKKTLFHIHDSNLLKKRLPC